MGRRQAQRPLRGSFAAAARDPHPDHPAGTSCIITPFYSRSARFNLLEVIPCHELFGTRGALAVDKFAVLDVVPSRRQAGLVVEALKGLERASVPFQNDDPVDGLAVPYEEDVPAPDFVGFGKSLARLRIVFPKHIFRIVCAERVTPGSVGRAEIVLP